MEAKNKYHKPNIVSEKAFEARTEGFSIMCYCNSSGGGTSSCSNSQNDSSGF